MKRILLLSLVLAFTLTAFSACGKAEEKSGSTEGGPGAATPFNVQSWLEIEANAMAFQYIDVSVYPNIWDRDAEPIGHIEANELIKKSILDVLEEVFFAPMQSPADFTVDFAFAMNEPFVFFGFTDAALLVKVPSEDGIGYLYYEAKLDDYRHQLHYLRGFIEGIRTNYYWEEAAQ